jgi:integrase/recombinase XerD
METITALVPRQSGGVAVGTAAEQVTEAWLANRRLSEHTRAAYRRGVAGWLAWCAGRDLDPLRASFLWCRGFRAVR